MISSVFLINSLHYNKEEYDAFSDEELIEKMKDGDDHAEKCLYIRYTFVVKRITSSFFIIGSAMDDLFQEAMIGLIKAVGNYNAKLGSSFRTFAELCIRRQIVSAIRKSKVYKVINNNISLYDSYDLENDFLSTYEYAEMDKLNPEYVFINEQEENNYFEITSQYLSKFEKAVLTEYGKGKSYEEISLTLNKNIKSIDNALQRVKKKMYSHKKRILY
ncbi:MAG: sigma-70 family RNA polymerase sigma factor [Sedimentibacter sp.]